MNTDPQEEFTGLWDKENPSSVYNRVPRKMQEAMDAIPDDLRYKSEYRLRGIANPSPTLKNARMQFWQLFSAHPNAKISMRDAFNHSVSVYNSMLGNPRRLMWFLTPPDNAMDTQKVMLIHTLELLQSTLKDENLYLTKRKVKKHKDGTEEITESKELNVRAVSEMRRLADDLHNRITGGTNVRVRNAIVMGPGSDLSQLASANAVLSAAEDPGTIEVHETRRNDRATLDNSDDISDFMDEENE